MQQCGGRGTNATYGDVNRPIGTDCQPCSTANTGFSFSWQYVNDLFQALAVSRAGAASSWDCLAEFAQVYVDWDCPAGVLSV